MSDFVILGAGLSGMTAASVLARLGGRVTVVEQSSIVGGHVTTSSYCCKATETCSRCGVCTAHTQLSSSLPDSRIELLTSSSVERFAVSGDDVSLQVTQSQPFIQYSKCISCSRCVSACPVGCIQKYQRAEVTQYIIDHTKCLRYQGKECTACADVCESSAMVCGDAVPSRTIRASAALVATGHAAFDAREKPRYGYASSQKIMTGLEAESALADRMHFGAEDERVAFVQCVGSRDPSIGRNFCSGICCAYALRMARMLKFRNPKMDITVFYIDLQNFDRSFTSLVKEVEDLGISLVQGLPFTIEEEADGTLGFTVESSNGKHEKMSFDRAILSVGIDSRPDAASTATTYGLSRDENGFFVSNNPHVYTSGTCSVPMSIPESMAAARATAISMWEGVADG